MVSPWGCSSTIVTNTPFSTLLSYIQASQWQDPDTSLSHFLNGSYSYDDSVSHYGTAVPTIKPEIHLPVNKKGQGHLRALIIYRLKILFASFSLIRIKCHDYHRKSPSIPFNLWLLVIVFCLTPLFSLGQAGKKALTLPPLAQCRPQKSLPSTVSLTPEQLPTHL
jgi:hypothetical protein